jgi:hypothetical protein
MAVSREIPGRRGLWQETYYVHGIGGSGGGGDDGDDDDKGLK